MVSYSAILYQLFQQLLPRLLRTCKIPLSFPCLSPHPLIVGKSPVILTHILICYALTGKGLWRPATCSICILQRMVNTWMTLFALLDSILLFVISFRSSFVTESFVYLKEVLSFSVSLSVSLLSLCLFSLSLCLSLFSSISFYLSSCMPSTTILSIVLYFGNCFFALYL